jgi:GNAT superfamily N-acetyltransferase
MDKYPQLIVFPNAAGRRVWRKEVHTPVRRKLTPDEYKYGPRCNLPEGIHIVTVSKGTSADLFTAAHLLNLASKGKRTTHANGFVPTDNYDSAIVVVDSRVVGGIIADRGRAIHLRAQLRANGTHKIIACQPDDRNRPQAVIFDLWVHPAHRRKGLARQLVIALAGHFGCSPGELGFRVPISKAAVQLLRSMGLDQVVGCN